MLKKVIIPVAAFAVTATSVSAFNVEALRTSDINLTDAQLSAIEAAETLKVEGASREEVESVLAAAGIDADVLRDIHQEARTIQEVRREAITAALAANDYEAFVEAAAGTPMAEKVDSADTFALLVQAHTLMEEAETILTDIGLTSPQSMGHRPQHKTDRVNPVAE